MERRRFSPVPRFRKDVFDTTPKTGSIRTRSANNGNDDDSIMRKRCESGFMNGVERVMCVGRERRSKDEPKSRTQESVGAAGREISVPRGVNIDSNTSSRTWRRRSSAGGGGTAADDGAEWTSSASSSATMKLVSRLRAAADNRDGHQQPPVPPSPPSTLPGGRRLSVAAAPPSCLATSAASARDRSRSLCVERLGLATLLHPAAIPARELSRRRASSAL